MLSIPIDDPAAYTAVGVPIDVAPDATLLNVSPDGRLVAQATDLAEVTIVEVATGSRRVIVQASDLAAFVPSSAPVWAPGSRSLVFAAGLYPGDDPGDEVVAVWHVNVDGSGLRQLIAERGPDLRIEPSEWQPVWP